MIYLCYKIDSKLYLSFSLSTSVLNIIAYILGDKYKLVYFLLVTYYSIKIDKTGVLPIVI